jgi:AraC-like DNA-binding protein
MGRIRKGAGFENEQFFVIPNNFLEDLSKNPLSQFLTVTDIGYFPHAEYHFRQRPKGINTAILLYCSAGDGYCSLPMQEKKPLSKGDLLVIPPFTPHEYGASQENPWSIYWVHCKGSYFDAFNQNAPRFPVVIPDFLGERLKKLFRQCFIILRTPYQNEEFLYLCQLVATIFALVNCAAKQPEIPFSVNADKGLVRAVMYMQDHLHSTITLEELCKASMFSSSHLHHLFKHSTGYAPIEYFLRIKMQAASHDLCFSALPVVDIAEEYGFEDPYYFSRIFKKIMGLSPQKFRSLHPNPI